jgi:CelD/BcsL family acetyltransferase involved in cellulose biosynthesis
MGSALTPERFTIEPVPGLEALAARWQALERRSRPRFFLGWRWMAAWMAATGIEPLLLVGQRDGQDVALALLGVRRGRLGARIVALNETGLAEKDVGYVEYNGVLGCAGGREAIDAVARFLMTQRSAGPIAGWDELRLGGVAPEWIESVAACGARVVVRARQWSYAVDLDRLRAEGRGGLAAMNANTRQQISRARRLYDAAGGLALRRLDEPVAQLAALDELAALHQARWVARGEPGAFASPVFDRLVRELITGSAGDGRVEILRVSVGGRTIALLLNLVQDGEVANYAAGFVRESDNRLKPGLVAHALAIEHHLARGSRVYDLLAGSARYKQSLAAPREEMVWLSVRPDTLRARALAVCDRIAERLARRRRAAAVVI